MAAIDYYKLSDEEKKIILQTTGERIGLPAYAVEKDWWVVQTLRVLYQMKVGQYLLFKGGTSLSKAWGLIDRFSEDIDLALNREFLGFDSGIISKTQVRKLRIVSYEYITENFRLDLEVAFKNEGIDKIIYEYENLGDRDQDPISLLIIYPNVIEYPEYITSGVKVEIGSRSMKDPHSDRSIISIIGETFPDRPYADSSISIPCINPERTYLEKLFLLHEEFQKPEEKIRVNRLSRHLFDIYRISQSEFKPSALNPELIKSIILHRASFNNMKGVDYGTHYPPNLNSIPPDKYIKAWDEDYKTMQTSMIHGKSPSFQELIDQVKNEMNDYNRMKI